jgi:ubiquinone/menaquinone biosynthesis C-methylase UbiE
MTDVPTKTHATSPISRTTATLHSPPETHIPDFDHLAPIYRWLEYLTFGPFLQRCRVQFVPQVAHCRRALILGDGDGRFTARLLRENPAIRVHAVDASSRMMECLRQNSDRYGVRLTTEVTDIRTWMPANSAQYDLVVTHFFLDCLGTPEVEVLGRRLSAVLSPNALWLVSEFAIPPTFFGRTIAAPLVACLYRVFRRITNLIQQSLPDHPSALAASGWSLQTERAYLGGLLTSQLWKRRVQALNLTKGPIRLCEKELSRS